MEILNEFIYYFDNEESNRIIKKYNISIYRLFDEDTQLKGLTKLTKLTLKQLQFFKENEYFFLYLESLRFFCFSSYNQYFYNNLFTNYYNNILTYFHDNNLLIFKKKFKPYKSFRVKIPIIKIHFKYYNINYILRYNSFKDLKNDFGRYRTEKIIAFRKDKNQIYLLEDILKIIED